jgi:hypothetical protein
MVVLLSHLIIKDCLYAFIVLTFEQAIKEEIRNDDFILRKQ